MVVRKCGGYANISRLEENVASIVRPNNIDFAFEDAHMDDYGDNCQCVLDSMVAVQAVLSYW